MIKDNQKYFNRLHLLVDAVVIALSYSLGWLIKFATPLADTEPGVLRHISVRFILLYPVMFCYIISLICTRQNGRPGENTRLQGLLKQIR